MKASPIRVISRGVFVPEWGNGAREPNEKITIRHGYLTFAEQQELLHYDDMGVNFAYESRLVAKMIDKEGPNPISNLAVEDEKNKVRQIKTGEDLVNEPALDKLALEVWLHFRTISALDAEGKKKSPSESKSGSKAKTSTAKEDSPATDG